MTSTPCGRVAVGPFEPSAISPDLALGIDLALASTWREIEDVRAILREDRLPADRGEVLLASAARRIEAVRAALSV